ncbi:hypothetical protein O181_081353 [Austropuccinia psidii MF-1]|uniref:Uncharacterized protein n=1 Tax=Austropuccinia psidii MF-1 TaxID=1389203 RepID=A0A9Q3FKG4_9BASI|nr:hypothetical protein [Austropuccinia psidii MF-1]
MSKEDQINLISYANLFTSLLVAYLGAQEITIQARRVLSQPQIITLLYWCCGNSSLTQARDNWPYHIIYGQLDPLVLYGLLANSPPHQPQPITFAFGRGGSFQSSRGLWPLGPTPYISGAFRPPTASMACGP